MMLMMDPLKQFILKIMIYSVVLSNELIDLEAYGMKTTGGEAFSLIKNFYRISAMFYIFPHSLFSNFQQILS